MGFHEWSKRLASGSNILEERGFAMRLTLIDVVVLGGLFAAGTTISAAALHLTSITTVTPFAIIAGVFTMIGFASMIYRRCRFRPLFLPILPALPKEAESVSNSCGRVGLWKQ